MKNKLTMREHKDGYTHFYWGRRDITGLWMNFFSRLSFEQESHSVEIFIRRYGKKLDAKLI